MSLHATFSLPEDVTKIYIVSRGDLAVQGEVRDTVRVTYTKGDDQPRLEPTDAGAAMRLTIDGDGRVQLPHAVNLVLSTVAGDLTVNNVQADVNSADVQGDAVFRACGQVSLGDVNGDVAFNHVATVRARNVHGDCALRHVERGTINAVHGDMAGNHCTVLVVETVDGDCTLAHTEREVQISTVRGDAVINDARGDVAVGEVGGDLVFRSAPVSGDAVRLRAWGTVTINLEGPVRVHHLVGSGEWDELPGWDEIRAQPAAGNESAGAEVLVAAGHELILTGVHVPHAFSPFEKRSGPSKPRTPPRATESPNVEFEEPVTVATQARASTQPTVDDDEALMVLKMIQEGKITPEQGDMLLDALSK